ncbi:MAG TPA: hypothetical protein VGC79_03330 [Polyangiaceae bacterium]
MFLRSWRAWLVGAALFAVGGCLSPTLPLPPPGDPTVSATDTAGLVRLTGSVEPESHVLALNHSTGLIRGQYTKSGLYDFTLEAQERDGITLWYEQGSIESPPTDFVIKLEPPP